MSSTYILEISNSASCEQSRNSPAASDTIFDILMPSETAYIRIAYVGSIDANLLVSPRPIAKERAAYFHYLENPIDFIVLGQFVVASTIPMSCNI